MKFDKTGGRTPRYSVSIYSDTVEDKYYFHYLNDANRFFDSLLRCVLDKGTIISIFDMHRGVRRDSVTI